MAGDTEAAVGLLSAHSILIERLLEITHRHHPEEVAALRMELRQTLAAVQRTDPSHYEVVREALSVVESALEFPGSANER
jgi:hypothetical protein